MCEQEQEPHPEWNDDCDELHLVWLAVFPI